MAVSQVGSTTTSYYVTNGTNGASTSSKTATSSSTTVSSATTRSGSASTTSSATTVSSTTAVSSTTRGSGSASKTSSTTVISSTTSYASATAKTTCSTTVTYSGSSSTAKVSSTTIATVEPTVNNKGGASASTTAIIEGDKYKGLTGSSLLFNISMDHFGFSGVESSNMFKLYEGILNNYGEDANYQFARVIASCTYGDQQMWRASAGLMDTTIVDIFMLYNGLTIEEASSLKKALQNQALVVSNDKDKFAEIIYDEKEYNACGKTEKERIDYLYNQFEGSVDFTHMFATIASSLYENKDTYMHKIALDLCTDDLTLEEASGYGGDIFGVSYEGMKEPSLNNSDYMADLDAVNIYARIDSSTNIMEAMLEYYSDLTNGKTNRATEFVENLGGEAGLEDLRNRIEVYDKNKDASIAWKFYNSIANDSEVLLN